MTKDVANKNLDAQSAGVNFCEASKVAAEITKVWMQIHASTRGGVLLVNEIRAFYKDIREVICDNKEAYPIGPRQEPAVPIKQSVKEDYIVCLEDGKKLKMIKRHLAACYGMSVAQYKEKWGLPPEYPTVAPSYSKKRATLAKKAGLGSRIKKA